MFQIWVGRRSLWIWRSLKEKKLGSLNFCLLEKIQALNDQSMSPIKLNDGRTNLLVIVYHALKPKEFNSSSRDNTDNEEFLSLILKSEMSNRHD